MASDPVFRPFSQALLRETRHRKPCDVTTHHFNFWTSRYESGRGANARWNENAFDALRVVPQYLMGDDTYKEMAGRTKPIRIALRDVARSTDTRTMILACIP